MSIKNNREIAQRAKGNRKRNITDISFTISCHIAQEVGAWGLPRQLECDHRFSGGNIGVGKSDHFNIIQCGNAILAHTARADFQPAFQTCLRIISFGKFVLPKSRVRKSSGRRQNYTKTYKIRRMCFCRNIFNNAL
jgi:hypothetical protein